jgi:hypothetical protein
MPTATEARRDAEARFRHEMLTALGGSPILFKETTSVPSLLNYRVEALELDAGVGGGEAPVDAG